MARQATKLLEKQNTENPDGYAHAHRNTYFTVVLEIEIFGGSTRKDALYVAAVQ